MICRRWRARRCGRSSTGARCCIASRSSRRRPTTASPCRTAGICISGSILPALHTPAIGDAVFVRDSSGSVFDETQAQFDAEILSVFHSLKPARLIVMDCDTRVTQVQIFERGDSPEIKPVRGGGGTAFADPFNRVAAGRIESRLSGLFDRYGWALSGSRAALPGAVGVDHAAYAGAARRRSAKRWR